MNIDDHRLRVMSQFNGVGPLPGGKKRIFNRIHINTPLHMQNAYAAPVRQAVKARPFSGGSGGIIRRTQQTVFRVQKRLYFFGDPAMIARSNNIGAAGEQFAADA